MVRTRGTLTHGPANTLLWVSKECWWQAMWEESEKTWWSSWAYYSEAWEYISQAMWEPNVWNNGHSASTHWPPWRSAYNSPRVPVFQNNIIHYEWKVSWRLTVHSRTAGKWNQCWQWIVVVRNPKFSEEVPALLDDVVGFIAKYIAKYCDGMSVVIWSDHRCDGVIFHGHPNYRSGEA